MDTLLTWFDLSAPGGGYTVAAEPMPIVQQALLYAVVVVGVLASEAVAMARTGGPIHIALDRTWVIVACVIALVVFPVVWHELGVNGERSLLVQAGLAAQGGVFWGMVVAGAEKRSSEPDPRSFGSSTRPTRVSGGLSR